MKRARPVALSPEERAFDLAAWVEDSVTVIERNGREWTCACPKCGGEKLAVNVSRKVFQCWHCGFAGWSPIKLLLAFIGYNPVKAGEILAAYNRDTLALTRPLQVLAPPDAQDDNPVRPLPVAPLPPGYAGALDGVEAGYAYQRGIPSDHAYWFGLSSIRPCNWPPKPDGKRWAADAMLAGRLLFPVWHGGRLVQWVARDTRGGDIKTVNLPASCEDPERHEAGCTCKHRAWGLTPVPDVAGTSEVLLGAHLLRPKQRVFVVEGPVDAAVCGPGFVATQGARLSLTQMFLLLALDPVEVVLCFDGDDAGFKATRNAYDLLEPIIGSVRAAQCPPGRDPGEMGRNAVVEHADRTGTTAVVPVAGRVRAPRIPVSSLSPVIPKI